MQQEQQEFDSTIGQLDRVISLLVIYAKGDLDAANKHTLKHHAEDMQAAGAKILNTLGLGTAHDIWPPQ